MLEADKERRRFRLGMKQLEPTSIDEYMAEHKTGEVVSGRVVDVSGDRIKVELGEGVTAFAPVPEQAQGSRRGGAKSGPLVADADAERRNGNPGAEQRAIRRGASGPARSAASRSIQIDAEKKRIELELQA